jgi:hypothetical protein
VSHSQVFAGAVEFAAIRMEPSIVQSSVASACTGHFGDHHATDRTHGSKLFINPLMGLYWYNFEIVVLCLNVKELLFIVVVFVVVFVVVVVVVIVYYMNRYLSFLIFI